MTTMGRITRYIVLPGLLCLLCAGASARGQRDSLSEPRREARPDTRSAAQQQRERYGRLVTRADRFFIRGDYDRAMPLYERGYARTERYTPQQAALSLKLARLYTLLQRNADAARHFAVVYEQADSLLGVSDACYYIDALLRLDDAQSAEVVARHYAFRWPHSRNQRYLNTLNSLSDLRHYYGRGDSDFAVTLLESSGALPEYWVGEIKGRPFYTVSRSQVQDPRKIYYHQTEFVALDEDERRMPFAEIPRPLQSGPMVYSEDGRFIIATGITYRAMDRIATPGGDYGLYINRLFYSRFDSVRNRWSEFLPLFEQDPESSYAHPVFTDGGRTLIFSSDCPGGYGGMDLYTMSWDEAAQSWGVPQNMGPLVNTEGDEIYPRVHEGALFFSSNGHEGYGGYDIYRLSYQGGVILPGSLFHYPYPINTVYNDFGIYLGERAGYFVSDRRGEAGRDDIYSFDVNVSPLGASDVVGVSAEYQAMTGKLNLIQGLSANTQTFERDYESLEDSPVYTLPQVDDQLLSVYFDFDSDRLDEQALEALRKLLETPGLDRIVQLSVLGYADDFGSDRYNQRLSERRALRVADFLREAGISGELVVEGRGRTSLDPQVYREAVVRKRESAEFTLPLESEHINISSLLSKSELIRINRKARRVEIVVRKINE